MDGLELLTSVFLDDLARNPTATREENPAGAAPGSDAPPGPGTRPMSPPSSQPAWTASAPPFLGAPAFRARQSLSRQGQDRRCLLAPLSTPAYSSASTPAVRWRATSFAQPYMWASLRKHLPFPHPQPGAAGVSLTQAHQNHLTDFFNNKKAQLYSNPLAILVQVPTLPTKPQQIHSLHHQSHRFFPFKV